MLQTKIEVLDRGYVKLVGVLGSELTISNAGQQSVGKRLESEDETVIRRLQRFANATPTVHEAPFRHCAVTLNVKAPMFVKNQWHTYVVSSAHRDEQFGWSERSFRYTKELEFYKPEDWVPFDKEHGDMYSSITSTQLSSSWENGLRQAVANYQDALNYGVKPELARLFLPAYALYTTWTWTASLQTVAHFILQRTDQHAQAEIRSYAHAVKALVKPWYPAALAELVEGMRK
jgi:thymidylate synthase (FAD)